MNCKVVLHSILRQKLTGDEVNGEIYLDLPEEASIRDVLIHFDLPPRSVCVLNNQLEKNIEKTLKDGDVLHLFRPTVHW